MTDKKIVIDHLGMSSQECILRKFTAPPALKGQFMSFSVDILII